MADNRNSRNEKHLGLSPDPSRPQPAEAMLLEGDEKSSEVEKYRDNPSPVPFHGEAWKRNLILITKYLFDQEAYHLPGDAQTHQPPWGPVGPFV